MGVVPSPKYPPKRALRNRRRSVSQRGWRHRAAKRRQPRVTGQPRLRRSAPACVYNVDVSHLCVREGNSPPRRSQPHRELTSTAAHAASRVAYTAIPPVCSKQQYQPIPPASPFRGCLAKNSSWGHHHFKLKRVRAGHWTAGVREGLGTCSELSRCLWCPQQSASAMVPASRCVALTCPTEAAPVILIDIHRRASL